MPITDSEFLRTKSDAKRVSQPPPGEPVELVALRSAIDPCVVRAGHYSLVLVARTAEALDELREELAQVDLVIAEQQARIGQLRKLFPDPDTDSSDARPSPGKPRDPSGAPV